MTASVEDPASTVEDYYEALRRGEPLYPYFAEDPSAVKFGIGESLFGYDEIAEGLREQTRVTEDWSVESHRLTVGGDDEAAWFSDLVGMAWTERGDRRSYVTRWSGSLRRREGEWTFVELHVSVAHDPATGDLGEKLDGNADPDAR